MHLNGENCQNVTFSKMLLNGGKLAGSMQMDRRFMVMKKCPQGVVGPCPGAIYMYMTIIFKHLSLRNRLANQSQTLSGVSLGKGSEI